MGTVRRIIDEGFGPWTLSEDGTCLVRRDDQPLDEWPRQSGCWPRDERIPVRPEKPFRVAVVGESVARGFLLDPVVTLPDLCRAAFREAGLDDRLELVDFTVNGLSAAGAAKLCRAATELRCSMIVLYVGNNFPRSTPWLDDPETRQDAARTFAGRGYEDYLAARREAMAAFARDFCHEVGETCRAAGVPLVVVVPATNQLDWHAPWVVPTWLPEDRLAEWTATRRQLDEPADGTVVQDPARHMALAERMTTLDGGTTARPMEIVGRSLVLLGHETEGVGLLSRAVSVGADPANYERRCPTEVAEQLRLLGRAPGCRIVDVPARARERYGVAAWGKEIFLDYCHHTLDSLRDVAADIAAEVYTGLGLTPAPGWPERLARTVSPPAREMASAYLLSALHNQHWGQSADTVEHWLRCAVETDPTCVEDLATYFAMSLPEAQFWLLGDALAARSERMYWFLKNFSHLPVLDAGFAERALRVLPEGGRQRLAKELDTLWRELRVERRGEINLLDTFWRERDSGPRPFTVVAGESSPVSRYGFIASGEHPLHLDIVLVAGPGLPRGRFDMWLNGHHCRTGQVTSEWQHERVVLPSAMLRAGANELTYAWTTAARDADVATAAVSTLGTGPENLHLVRLARMRLTP
ncbi:hypothetical protein ABT269_12280 [Streptomyces viridosporus]|uniref:hypothetical protein n=1 Tax=Streptomyces viridosporus TaxID=67581 RepID=UPI00332D749F